MNKGKIVEIIGPVIDVEFPRGSLPELNRALEFTVSVDGQEVKILAEVAQQLGDSRVRAVIKTRKRPRRCRNFRGLCARAWTTYGVLPPVFFR